MFLFVFVLVWFVGFILISIIIIIIIDASLYPNERKNKGCAVGWLEKYRGPGRSWEIIRIYCRKSVFSKKYTALKF